MFTKSLFLINRICVVAKIFSAGNAQKISSNVLTAVMLTLFLTTAGYTAEPSRAAQQPAVAAQASVPALQSPGRIAGL